MKSIAVVIHARTTSTRVPNKHLRDLGDGNTLIDIAIDNVNKLKNVEEKYLAVNENVFKSRVKGDVVILHREWESIKPGNAPHDIMYKHLENVKSEYIVNYNPCQPFLDVDKLQKAIDWFKSSEYDSAITVEMDRNFYWDSDFNPVNFSDGDRLSTTSGPYLYKATHSLVFYKKDYMLTNWQLFSNSKNDPFPIVIDYEKHESVDVDTETDFLLVKSIYNLK